MSGDGNGGPRPGVPKAREKLPGRPTTTLARAKEEAIDVLAECFAQDLMTVAEFERRVSIVHAAESMSELGEAVAGIRTRGTGAPQDEGRAQVEALQRMRPDVPAGRVRQSDRAIAVLGNSKRVGGWMPARRNTAVAVLGSVVLDLREALLGPWRVHASTWQRSWVRWRSWSRPGSMWSVQVPPILGSFGEELRHEQPGPIDPDAPTGADRRNRGAWLGGGRIPPSGRVEASRGESQEAGKAPASPRWAKEVQAARLR